MKMENKEDFFFGIKNDNMSIEEYLQQINSISQYYFKSCEKYKKRFYICSFVRIISSALIPVISLAAEINWSTIVVSVLASIVIISESYVSVTRAYEKWTTYRDTCNLLWIEQRKFAIRAGAYSDEATRKEIFVNNCESIFLHEMGEWRNYIERAKEMGK